MQGKLIPPTQADTLNLDMSYTYAPLSFDSLTSSWNDLQHHLNWSSVFVLPQWLKVWWQEFGGGSKLYLFDVKQDKNIIGIAPLMVKEGNASFIGSADVCDYMDFIVAPGKELPFFTAVLDKLKKDGINELALESLRHDSTVLTSLVNLAKTEGYQVTLTQENVSLDLDLPSTWDDYLKTLSPKQRRETGRRFRRLDEEGDINYRVVENAEPEVLDIFFKLLRESREDKAAFMTPQMESFFRALAQTIAEARMLRLSVLEISAKPVAAVMCFDYNDKVYLYNSGYDPEYGYLSAGLLSKFLSIRDSIERGRKAYDFLKGPEEYKYRLRGREIPIYSCRIILT
jgi:CelD/BcsL family acetyltransferase involved in cellulose biosynthesis